jgi:hypothetical protein
MTEAQALEAISARWADPTTGWPSLQPGIQWTFENLKFDAADRWARVTVDCTSGRQASLGPAPNRRIERRGRIFVQVFGPRGEGRAGVAALVESVRALFEAQQIAHPSGGEPLTTYAASQAGNGSDGRWFMYVDGIPFVFHDRK